MFPTIFFIYCLVMYMPWKQLNRDISGYYYSSLIQIPVIYIQCYDVIKCVCPSPHVNGACVSFI